MIGVKLDIRQTYSNWISIQDNVMQCHTIQYRLTDFLNIVVHGLDVTRCYLVKVRETF
jgi:hypothetical protein